MQGKEHHMPFHHHHHHRSSPRFRGSGPRPTDGEIRRSVAAEAEDIVIVVGQ